MTYVGMNQKILMYYIKCLHLSEYPTLNRYWSAEDWCSSKHTIIILYPKGKKWQNLTHREGT